MAKRIIWDDLRDYGHVDRYLAGECAPIYTRGLLSGLLEYQLYYHTFIHYVLRDH